MLLERKVYETYLEAMAELKSNLYNKYNITLSRITVMLDFELAAQKALRQAFGNQVTIKGCWFHFCQAILTNLGKIGLKKNTKILMN